jgi:Rieske 2Fe-2S family protein
MSQPSVPLERSLPREYYLDPALFARERERIFRREWFCAARGAEFTQPGEWLLRRVADESVFVTRDRDGALQAFLNLCRHRGAQLLPQAGDAAQLERKGHGRFPAAIRCPYHNWTYELDGALRMAPHLDDCLADVRGSLGLHRVAAAEWGGFVFLKLDCAGGDAAADLAHQLGPVPERVRRYPLAQLGLAHRIVYEVRANWKVIVENYNECYHCGPVHPGLCELVPAFRQAGGAGLDWDRGIPHRAGADTFTTSGTSSRASFPALNADEQVLHKGELIYPNLMISLAREHVAAFRLWPEECDRTTVVCDFLFHPDEMCRSDFDPTDAVDFWDGVNREDWAICESVQRGMGSRAFVHGWYAPMEDLSLDIRRYVRERLDAAD